MKPIKDMSAKELLEEYQELYDMIYLVECFGSQDLVRLMQVENELDRRGNPVKQLVRFEYEEE